MKSDELMPLIPNTFVFEYNLLSDIIEVVVAILSGNTLITLFKCNTATFKQLFKLYPKLVAE
jgi:hypothetical protein